MNIKLTCFNIGASIISVPPFSSGRPTAPIALACAFSIACAILAARRISEDIMQSVNMLLLAGNYSDASPELDGANAW